MVTLRAALAAFTVLLIAACSPIAGPAPSPSALSAIELKYRLLARVGPIDYCDPDAYPLAHPTPPAYVAGRLSEIAKTDPQTYQAILAHYRMKSPLTEQEQTRVYADYKQLSALQLNESGGNYRFSYLVGVSGNKQPNQTNGSIDRSGVIKVDFQKPSFRICPICLAASTWIATPEGPIAVPDLRPGMTVWTADASGRRQPAVVLRVGNMEAPTGHEVVHLVLADGREVFVSPGHPTADGRHAGDLVRGEELDRSRIVMAERIPYVGKTYDLLPSGPTGVYWANDVLLASTIRSQAN